MSELIPQIDPQKLRAARLAAKLEQKDIAAVLKVRVSQVSNLESGYSRIQSHHLAIWASLCGVNNLHDLYTEAEPNAFHPIHA